MKSLSSKFEQSMLHATTSIYFVTFCTYLRYGLIFWGWCNWKLQHF